MSDCRHFWSAWYLCHTSDNFIYAERRCFYCEKTERAGTGADVLEETE